MTTESLWIIDLNTSQTLIEFDISDLFTIFKIIAWTSTGRCVFVVRDSVEMTPTLSLTAGSGILNKNPNQVLGFVSGTDDVELDKFQPIVINNKIAIDAISSDAAAELYLFLEGDVSELLSEELLAESIAKVKTISEPQQRSQLGQPFAQVKPISRQEQVGVND